MPTDGGRQFQWVNATRPGRNLDQSVRKIVRTHVMNDHVRQKKHQKLRNQNAAPSRAATPSQDERPGPQFESPAVKNDVVPGALGYPSALTLWSYPIPMTARTHALLNHYVYHVTERLYPLSKQLKFNPFRGEAWFQFAVTDAAMLHALLYSGANYISLLEGKRESEDSVYHLGKTVEIVNRRLQESVTVDDSTIGALTCVALGESMSGHLDLWHVHMRGLKELIKSREDMNPLSHLLRIKLHRTDVAGAMDYAESPYLPFERANIPRVWSVIPAQQQEEIYEHLSSTLYQAGVRSDLVEIMVELAYFSSAVLLSKGDSMIQLNPSSLTEDMYWIQHQLLSFSSAPASLHGIGNIDAACRLGGLLYMKALLEEIPHSYTGPSILLDELRTHLEGIASDDGNSSLLTWLTLLGLQFTKQDLPKQWFAKHLSEIAQFPLGLGSSR
ncbi:hypothetical protein BP6252_05583 [Coleophoma cylindrospora]|uniref:Uncharacterized protein n=1 Tax=Coleophoma cylindrospora TaxID=1849047 RepID=A0A3D8RU91_9HELO|nr:hypothetical protein BP6252_05583 [Coleophoma cylindrospora]